MAVQVGTISARVIEILNLQLVPGMPIILGESNIAHMKSSHPQDYLKYGENIELILSEPDYVGQNPSDGSIEYVKEFQIADEFVKVAVRVSSTGTLFARSLYVLNNNRVVNFINKGTLKKV